MRTKAKTFAVTDGSIDFVQLVKRALMGQGY
jgi:hypothetical protein